MVGRSIAIGLVGAALVGAQVLAGPGFPAGASAPGGAVTLPGSHAPWATASRSEGELAPSTPMSVQLWLRADLAGATAYAASVSQPGSPDYRHYLSPNAYTARFGASARSASAVVDWLAHNGFRHVRVDPERAYVSATAPAATAQRAFHVEEVRYRQTPLAHAYGRTLFANDRPVSLPASVATDVIGVAGLTDEAPLSTLEYGPAAASQRRKRPSRFVTPACSHWYGQHIDTHVPALGHQTRFSTALCGYTANQLRAAYGASPSATGKGVTVALIELGLASGMYQTLVDYARTQHLTPPDPARYGELSLGKGDACGDPFYVEEQLDVESVYALAPGANILVVGGNSCGAYEGLTGLFGADEAVLDGNGKAPLATIASNSWESGPESQPKSFTAIEHSYLVRAVDEGVGEYFSAGDDPGVGEPSSDPDVTAVGGTSLGLSRSGGRLFETGWSDVLAFYDGHGWESFGIDGAGGGGPSVLWSEPSYQDGVVPAALATPGGNRSPSRVAPDISADADPETGFLLGLLGGQNGNTYQVGVVGGTSEASPLVAASVADAQQGESRPFGFINPLLYGLAGTSAFNTITPVTAATPAFYRSVVYIQPITRKLLGKRAYVSVFDDQTNPLLTEQVTLPGYNTTTGLGSPDGAAFRADLRAAAAR